MANEIASGSDYNTISKIVHKNWDFTLCRTPTDIWIVVGSFGDSSTDRNTVSRWSQTFEVQHSTEDKEFSGRPTTSIDSTSAFIVARILESDSRMTYDVMAVDSRIP